jgi:hypothetical protein
MFTPAFWASAIGTIIIIVVNVVTLSYFYGKLCSKVDGHTWQIDQLWKRVFNGGK